MVLYLFRYFISTPLSKLYYSTGYLALPYFGLGLLKLSSKKPLTKHTNTSIYLHVNQCMYNE